MTTDGTLFDLPEPELTPLDMARVRFADAQTAFTAAQDWEDESGEPVPRQVANEYVHAQRALAREEQAEIDRRKG